MDNFDFLKHINVELYKIILDAEELFRDEYFEQSIVQIRCYAENLAKDTLAGQVGAEDTFDDVIQKIKDNSFENVRSNEFADDLYFIKKNGNKAAHEGKIEKSGEIALECLERAFETGILYSHIKNGYDENLDKLQFSEELLITGKKTKRANLKETYVNELNKTREKENLSKTRIIKTVKKHSNIPKPAKRAKQINSMPKQDTENFYAVKIIFWGLFLLTVIIITLFALGIKI